LGVRVTVESCSPKQPAITGVHAPRRILVMGGAGAGKSTFARALGQQLGLPVTHLDRLRYDPGWRLVDRGLFVARLAELAATDAWVADGSYGESDTTLLPRADLVIWLDQPTPLRLYRSWRKASRKGQPRADRPDGCEEAFGWRYVWMIVSFGRWTPWLERRFRAAAPNARIVRLRGDREIARALGAR